VISIQGQLLRLSERREVAIYLRDGTLWVADFIDGDGELVDAPTWFRFNCGALSTYHARRRMVRESAIPLSRELVTRIEDLHRPVAPADKNRPRPTRDEVSPRRQRSAIARIFRRLFKRRSTHQGDVVGRRDASSRISAQPDAARMQSVGELNEIELYSDEENGL
jgi:hypothetical protein